MTEHGDNLELVDRLAGEFLARLRRGERVTVEEYVGRHPDLEEKIREVFAALVLIENFGSVEEERSAISSDDVPGMVGELREIGDYRIVRRIGRGGMGVVYEAEQVSLGRRVALKILPYHSLLSPGHLTRFQLEARAAARLHHPNIVPVHDVGESNGIHYYAMQFIRGQGLDGVLEEIRRLRGADRFGTGRPGSPDAARSRSERVAAGLLGGRLPISEGTRAGANGGAGAAADAETTALEASDRSPPPVDESSSSLRLPGYGDRGSSSDTLADYHRSVALIGLQVADALAHAHEAGVLHRDIKPSNLLLDLSGTVWVTDFGLAKSEGTEELTNTGDLVGTLRYMGPERFRGWSDSRSDVYSLGVTLFELLTLRPAFAARDRATLVREILHVDPPAPRRLDRSIPRDLETIVVKAMEKEPEKRYQSAVELARDLRRFLERRPIVARRISPRERVALWFRRNPVVASLTVAVAALLVVVAVVSIAAAVHQRRLAGDLLAERQATFDNLRRAYLEEARARRLSRRVGQRHEMLAVLGRAAAIEPGVDLRDEAIGALALHDLRRLPPGEWQIAERLRAFTFDSTLERYAWSDERGNVHVCRVAGRSELFVLPGPGNLAPMIRFSPDGDTLAAVHGDDLTLWSLRSRSSVTIRGGFDGGHVAFTSDARLFAAGGNGGVIRVGETATGKVFRRLPSENRVRSLSFQPGSLRLAAASHTERVEIWDAETGELERLLPTTGVAYEVAWHPGGRLLAVGFTGSAHIEVGDPTSWERRKTLYGHRNTVFHFAFSPSGDLLASHSWDGATILWDPVVGEELLEYEGEVVKFSSDGRRIGFRFANTAEIFEVVRPVAYRRIYAAAAQMRNEVLDFSPDGEWLTGASQAVGVRLWEVSSGREIAWLDIGAGSASFDVGGDIVTAGDRGLHRWPVTRVPSGDGERLRIGPPAALSRVPTLRRSALDAAGRTVVVCHGDHRDSGTHPHVVDLEEPQGMRSYRSHPMLLWIDISPDGRWIAGGTWHWRGIPVWDASRTDPVAVLPADDSAAVRFSPDGRWLVACSGLAYRFWKVGVWEEDEARRIPRRRVMDPPCPPAFTSDGRTIAIAHTLTAVKLHDVESGRDLATLEAPHGLVLSDLSFSPDGRYLAASSQTADSFLHLWDLDALRRELRTIGLDWASPSHRQSPGGASEREIAGADVLLGEFDSARRGAIERLGSLGETAGKLGNALTGRLDRREMAAMCARRAHANALRGDFDAAFADYERAIELDPESVLYRHSRGGVLRQLGRYAEAVREYEACLEKEPENPRYLNNLAWTLLTAPEVLRDAPRALDVSLRAVEGEPHSNANLNTLGLAYCRLGRQEEAIRTIENAMAARGGPTGLDYLFLAMAERARGRAAEARRHHERALRWRAEVTDRTPALLADFDRLLEEAIENGDIPSFPAEN